MPRVRAGEGRALDHLQNLHTQRTEPQEAAVSDAPNDVPLWVVALLLVGGFLAVMAIVAVAS